MKLSTKNAMVILMVSLLVTVPWEPPSTDSAMPPPRADPMPPSDFAGCASTRRIRNSETKIRMTVRIPRRILMEPNMTADAGKDCQCAVENLAGLLLRHSHKGLVILSEAKNPLGCC